ncbi:hypothetical protein [Cronobacter sakazakii]|uniref:hypothetical protein n=1 Tax=Cronobacter sakazakii TaxID=28141 RepID=UPI001F189371|nr:hypothetical protein [Cronobacter sakazakii]
MGTRFVVNFDFRSKNDDIQFSQIIEHFLFIIAQINALSKEEDKWYETGYSRKQALNHLAFEKGCITEITRLKWERRYKRSLPILLRACGMQMMINVAVVSLTEKCFMTRKIEFQ